MDTIPQGLRLTLYVSTQRDFTLDNRRRHRLAQDLEDIQHQVRLYNLRLRLTSLSDRATAGLSTPHLSQRLDGTIVLVHHDSPGWAATQSPRLPPPPSRAKSLGTGVYPRPINPSSRKELRDYAIRKGVSVQEAWNRFPPSSANEQAEMNLALASKRKAPITPLEAALRQAARKAKVSPHDPKFRATFQAQVDSLSSLLGDLL